MDSQELSQKALLYLIFIINLFVAFDVSSMPTALPTISEYFQVSLNSAQWVVSAYMLAQASSLLLFAYLGDKLGYIRLFRSGLITFSVGVFAALFSSSLSMLLVARVIQGLGASVLVATSVPLVTRFFEVTDKARALALLTSASSLGACLGPPVTGWLLISFSWRGAFIPVAFITIILFLGVWLWAPKETQDVQPVKPDLLAVFLFSVTTISFLLGLRGKPFLLAMAAVAGTALFVRIKQHTNNDMKQVAYKTAPGVSIILLTFSAVFSHVLIPTLLQVEWKLSASFVGIAMLTYPASVFLGTRVASRLSKTLSPQRGIAFALTIILCGIIGLALSANSGVLQAVLVSLSAVGIGLGIFIPNNSALMLENFPRQAYGLAGGIIGTGRSLGIALGVTIATTLLQGFSSYKTVFFIAAGVCLLALSVISLQANAKKSLAEED